jgi:hypothetical protein
MCHTYLSEASFYRQLQRIDADLAAEARQRGCPYCGGRLDVSDYPRKPRGVSRRLLGESYERRHSFCCAEADCRRRTTPASVRFLGRRVYLAVVVVLVSALANGVSLQRGRRLGERLGVSRRTLFRWRRWWREDFPRFSVWKVLQARLMPPVSVAALPASVLSRFDGADDAERLYQLLRFLSPISTRTGRLIAG